MRLDWHRLFDSDAWMPVPKWGTLVKLMADFPPRLEKDKRANINSVCTYNLSFQQKFYELVQIYRTPTFEYFLCPIKRTPDICRYHKMRHALACGPRS